MKIKILFILFLCFISCGCWNYNELNDFAIVTGIGFDKHEYGYKVSLMISNSQSIQSSSKEGEAATTVFTGVGETILEALNSIDVKSPRHLYLGHLAVAVIDEKLAQNDINPILETLMRNPESAKKYYLVLARENKSEDILKSLSPLESFPSQNISLNIESASENQGIANKTILSEFIITLLKPGVNGLISSISIQGNEDKIDNQDDLKNTEPNAMLKTKSIGLFKDSKLVAWASENESKGINIVNNKADKIYITNKLNDNDKINVLVDSIKCKMKINTKNNLSVVLNVKTSGSIVENNSNLDLEKPSSIEKINKETEKNIKKMINDGIDLSKKYKTDIFGFGNMVYKSDFKYWNQVKDEWDNLYYPNLKIKVKVDVNLKSKGALESTIKGNKR